LDEKDLAPTALNASWTLRSDRRQRCLRVAAAHSPDIRFNSSRSRRRNQRSSRSDCIVESELFC